MNSIGGNVIAELQTKTKNNKNQIGELIVDWATTHTIKGYLDLMGGDSKYTNFNAKVQESTHIFLCDYFNVDVTATESRMVIEGKTYDVKVIDDPMGMHEHLEIYLAYVR